MLPLRTSSGMAGSRQTRASKVGELRLAILSELWTASSLVFIAYHSAGRGPRHELLSVMPVVAVTPCSSMSAGEVLRFGRFRQRWRFRGDQAGCAPAPHTSL